MEFQETTHDPAEIQKFPGCQDVLSLEGVKAEA
jgi:hypothetical protein